MSIILQHDGPTDVVIHTHLNVPRILDGSQFRTSEQHPLKHGHASSTTRQERVRYFRALDIMHYNTRDRALCGGGSLCVAPTVRRTVKVGLEQRGQRKGGGDSFRRLGYTITKSTGTRRLLLGKCFCRLSVTKKKLRYERIRGSHRPTCE